MSAALHLDLLTDEERVSSGPVRLRVMVPIVTLLAALGLAVWWSLVALRVRAVSLQKSALEQSINELKSAQGEVLRLRAQEKDIAATLRQLAFYRNARLCFGETLALLTERVPENLQLTELRVPPPPPPLADPKKPALGPTNTFENVTLRFAGRAGGPATAAVNTLLETLRSPAFTNLIRAAEIPKGAFRQDTARGAANRDTLLFEISCECAPRRFQ